MKYNIIALICFGLLVCQLASVIHSPYPWTTGIILFIIGEVSFALGLGKMMKESREYHEKYIWTEEDNPEI